MFVRLRWFGLGVLATVGAGCYVVVKVRALRRRLGPGTVARVGVGVLADVVELAGRRLAASGPPRREEGRGG